MKTAIKKSSKTIWFCAECGHESMGYLGKCPMCGEWDSFKEAKFDKPSKKSSKTKKAGLFVTREAEIQSLQNIPEDQIARSRTGSEELDRVLGGGIVPGSLSLIAGQPGIGKSTILLQVANNFAQRKAKVLYISAEESSRQLKLRASRMSINSDISVLTEPELSNIIDTVEEQEPNLVIVDSIQATYLSNIDSLPGSPSQIRQCTGELMRLAKSLNIPIIIVGHINKDGDIAGPKILEHMVDTVLQFEDSQDSSLRFVRAIKNRFGSTDEVGVFSMESNGLRDITNPSEIFLDQKSDGVIVATKEGRRSILIELQAIALGSDYHNPRRVANGMSLARLHQILAILEKRARVSLAKSDIYLNVVGGLSIREPAADLAMALAIYKSVAEINSPADDFIAIGELGLAGELRAVVDCESRIKEALKLGFTKILAPEANLKKLDMKKLLEGSKAQIISIKNINQAINNLDP